jgi:hypothetical protein
VTVPVGLDERNDRKDSNGHQKVDSFCVCVFAVVQGEPFRRALSPMQKIIYSERQSHVNAGHGIQWADDGTKRKHIYVEMTPEDFRVAADTELQTYSIGEHLTL